MVRELGLTLMHLSGVDGVDVCAYLCAHVCAHVTQLFACMHFFIYFLLIKDVC